jgi:hypothetical protein
MYSSVIGGLLKALVRLRGQDIMHVVKLGQSREVVDTAQDVQTIDDRLFELGVVIEISERR